MDYLLYFFSEITRKISSYILKAVVYILFGRFEIDGVNHICVYRTANIGDMIVAVPAMREIRAHFPHAKITVLTDPGKLSRIGIKDVLANQGLYEDVVDYSEYKDGGKWTVKTLKNFIKGERRKKYDCFIQLPYARISLLANLKHIFYAKIIGAKKATGFYMNTVECFPQAQVKFRKYTNQAESLFENLPWKPKGKPEFGFVFSDEIKENVYNKLPVFCDRDSQPILAVSFFGKKGPKLYPISNFCVLIKKWIKEFGGTVVLMGGKDQFDAAEEIRRHFEVDQVINAAGMFSIQESMFMLKQSDLLLSVDTGTAHMAAAVDTWLIEIFSAYNYPGLWVAYGDKVEVIRHDLKCSPCLKDSCVYDDEYAPCMRAIAVDEVWTKMKEIGLKIIKEEKN